MDKELRDYLLEAEHEYNRMDYAASAVTQGMTNSLALASIAVSLNKIVEILEKGK